VCTQEQDRSIRSGGGIYRTQVARAGSAGEQVGKREGGSRSRAQSTPPAPRDKDDDDVISLGFSSFFYWKTGAQAPRWRVWPIFYFFFPLWCETFACSETGYSLMQKIYFVTSQDTVSYIFVS
jgi:hypothetical protein